MNKTYSNSLRFFISLLTILSIQQGFAQMRSTTCDVYMDAGPVNRTTAFTTAIDEENIASGVYTALAQRYNSLSGSMTGVRFWARVPVSVGVAQNAKVKVYAENVGYPATVLGQTTVSVPSSDSLNQIDVVFSTPISVSSNVIISIEPVTPASDNFWIGHNRAGDGLNLYLNLIKQGTSWYKNLANGDPSWDYDFLILPIKSATVTSNFNYTAPALTASFTNTSTGAASYLWDFGDGNSSTATSPSHTYSVAGSYDVKLKAYTATSACVDSTTTTVTVVATGINSASVSKKGLIITTNLVHDVLTVETSENTTATIYDVLGARVGTYELKQNQSQQINIESLQTGIYFISAGNTKPVRFVKL